MRRSFAFLGSKGSDSDDDSSHDSNRAKRSSSLKASSSTRFLGSSRSSPEHGAAGRFAAPIGRGWADASPSSTILDSRGGAHPPAGAGGSSPTRPSRRFGGLPIAPSGSQAFDTPGEGSLRSTFLGSSDAADVRSLLGSAPGSEPGPTPILFLGSRRSVSPEPTHGTHPPPPPTSAPEASTSPPASPRDAGIASSGGQAGLPEPGSASAPGSSAPVASTSPPASPRDAGFASSGGQAGPPESGPASAPGSSIPPSKTKADLVQSFFVPPESSLGKALRAKCPRAPMSRGNQLLQLAARQAQDLARRSSHVASCLPATAIGRILDGTVKGSSAAGSGFEPVTQAARVIATSGGRDGSSLPSKLSTLSRFADFAAVGGYLRDPAKGVDIFAVQVPPSMAGSYCRWERARGFVEGHVGTSPAALADLRFSRDHLGLDAPDLESGVVTSEASISVDVDAGEERPDSKKAGTIPLRLQMGREACANERSGWGPPDLGAPAHVWMCVRILCFLFGLRSVEQASARIEQEDDVRYIHISFFPKGNVKAVRTHAWRFAFGVMGPLLWWPRLKAFLSDCKTLSPRFVQSSGVTGDVMTASFLVSSGALPKGNNAWRGPLTFEPYGLPSGVLDSLGIQGHSEHGSLSDIITTFGTPLGFDPTVDGLIAGHWSGSSGTVSGASGSSDRAAPWPGRRADTAARVCARQAASSSSAMVATYSTGSHRDSPRVIGPETVWRVIALAYHAIRDLGLSYVADHPNYVDPHTGWMAAKEWATSEKEEGRAFSFSGVPPFPTPPFPEVTDPQP